MNKQNFIGFLKEEDKNIRNAKYFHEMFCDSDILEPLQRQRVIAYMKQGCFLTGIMSYIYDDEKKPIGNLDYYTDGVFVWPGYFLYYLEKYENYCVPIDFSNHVIQNKYLMLQPSTEQLKELEFFFDTEWTGRYKDEP